MSTSKPIAFISSTARDLPEHRKHVMDACHRATFDFLWMESWPASTNDGVTISLQMIDRADLYIGIFAYRYGTVPKGMRKSITEMEYDRAVERGIPCIIFFMHPSHPLEVSQVETGPGANKLKRLKRQIETHHVVAQFNSPEDLRGHVLNALITLERPPWDKGIDTARAELQLSFPQPPQPFVAHPYTLQQTRKLIGRRRELDYLTSWITGEGNLGDVRALTVVAIGGTGKSALTWHWFNSIAEQEWPKTNGPLMGRVWWSFYDPQSDFDTFVIYTLAYVTGRAIVELLQIQASERERRLLEELNHHPYLIAMDGLERILIAYARPDAAFLRDDEHIDEHTGHWLPGFRSSADQSLLRHRARRTSDLRAGKFLRALSRVHASRLLITTRLYPADLQADTGLPLPSCHYLPLLGLEESDSLELWREMGGRGSRGDLLPVFNSFDRHPLLIQILAGAVVRFRPAPGSFLEWRKAHPGFKPVLLDIRQSQTHVLNYSFRNLTPAVIAVLRTIAAFRLSTRYDILADLLVKQGDENDGLIADNADLDRALSELEDRGLVGWERERNSYDIHPIVRGTVWENLAEQDRESLQGNLEQHFRKYRPLDSEYIESIEKLRPEIELIHLLCDRKRFAEAVYLFHDRLAIFIIQGRFTDTFQQIFQRFFISVEQGIIIEELKFQHPLLLTSCGFNMMHSDQCQLGRKLMRMARELDEPAKQEDEQFIDEISKFIELNDHEIYLKEFQLHTAINSDKKNISNHYLVVLTNIMAVRGNVFDELLLPMELVSLSDIQLFSAFWSRDPAKIGECLNTLNNWYDVIQQETIHNLYNGEAIVVPIIMTRFQIELQQFDAAEQTIQFTRRIAEGANLFQEKILCDTLLARVRLALNGPNDAREVLDDVWEPLERCNIRTLLAEAKLSLAMIEVADNRQEEAARRATEAFILAWCDGPPYSQKLVLDPAYEILVQLGVDIPKLPPFDTANFPPMPEVDFFSCTKQELDETFEQFFDGI